MEHRGFDIKVVQTISGGKWKWLVQLPAQRRHGEERTRDLALFAARKAIDRALAPQPPKKVRLQPP
jgi:hypothetical protein